MKFNKKTIDKILKEFEGNQFSFLCIGSTTFNQLWQSKQQDKIRDLADRFVDISNEATFDEPYVLSKVDRNLDKLFCFKSFQGNTPENRRDARINFLKWCKNNV